MVTSISKTVAQKLAVGALLLGATLATAQAAVPAEITAISTDADTVWGTVKTFVVGVIAFFILVAIVKKIRKS